MDNNIILVGYVTADTTNKIHQWCYVYDENGIAPSLCARDYKTPTRILVRSLIVDVEE